MDVYEMNEEQHCSSTLIRFRDSQIKPFSPMEVYSTLKVLGMSRTGRSGV